MNDPTPPYQVPHADGGRRPDPGRGWRCLLILAVGAGPLSLTIASLAETLRKQRSVWQTLHRFLLNTGGNVAGALILPCAALVPLVVLALIENIHAWIAPTAPTVAVANRWLRRLWVGVGLAVSAGCAIALWIFYWGFRHFGAA
jgi:hypothetical protein